MVVLVDPITSLNLPTFVYSKTIPHLLLCACDMCFDEETASAISGIGPHDLHCVCPPCCEFAMDDAAYDEALEIRYSTELVENLTSRFSVPNIIDVNPNSPTAHEMHAINGNQFHQHHHGWGDFIRAAGRGLAGSTNPADKFALAGLGSSSLLGGSMLYTSMQNMAKPLSELREQFFPSKKQQNKEMHAYNGNMDDSWFRPTPGFMKKKPVDSEVPGSYEKRHDFNQQIKNEYRDWLLKHPHANTNKQTKGGRHVTVPGATTSDDNMADPKVGSKIVDYSKIIQDNLNKLSKQHPQLKDDPAVRDLKDQLKQNPDPNIINQIVDVIKTNHPDLPGFKKLVGSTGPTNKEMHTVNGNIFVGPAMQGVSKRKHKRQLRKLARKINHKAKPKVYKQTFKKVIAKPKNNKFIKRAGKEEKYEEILAKRYLAFLKQPVARPLRLGSTGNMPTKILHGFYELTVNMASAGGLTNATDLVAFITPKMFSYYASANAFGAPLNIGYAINATTAYTNVAATSAINTVDFANSTALKNETGVANANNDVPLARFLGGHVSLRCRCPMSNAAPPYLFGGLMPTTPIINNSTYPFNDPGKQLNQLTSQQIRGLPSTKEIEGTEGSSVWAPNSNNDLQFSPLCLQYINANGPCSSVPYIGMTGCPTTASVTIIVSSFWEIQQTSDNCNYGGWNVGPKVSTEDVLDHVPRFKTTSSTSLNQGVKTNSNAVTVASLMKPKPPSVDQELDNLKIQLSIMNQRFKDLKVLTDLGESDEDEKYICTTPPQSPVDTPGESTSEYRNLSKSTIDLALRLKDKLTPGSVTSKTSRPHLP